MLTFGNVRIVHQLGVKLDPMFRYVDQGFVALQRIVDRFILSRSSNFNATLNLTVNPFPTLAHTSDSKRQLLMSRFEHVAVSLTNVTESSTTGSFRRTYFPVPRFVFRSGVHVASDAVGTCPCDHEWCALIA